MLSNRNPARLWILPVIPLRLRLSPLDDHGVGPELRSRHLHHVAIVAVTRKPASENRFLYMAVRVAQTRRLHAEFLQGLVLIAHRHLRTPGCATRHRPPGSASRIRVPMATANFSVTIR